MNERDNKEKGAERSGQGAESSRDGTKGRARQGKAARREGRNRTGLDPRHQSGRS